MGKKRWKNIEVHGIAHKGQAVARNDDGEVVFIKGAVPGDVVDVSVGRKRKGVRRGTVEEIVEPSPDRVEPFCRHFENCGGCKWQHLNYEAQVRHKETVVRDNMERIGGIDPGLVESMIGAEKSRYYRNKMEYTFSNKRWLTEEEIASGRKIEDRTALGMHRPGQFDKVVDIDHCWLQPDPSNEIRNALKNFAREQDITFFDKIEQVGSLRQLIIRTSSLGQCMVILILGEENAEVRDRCMRFLEKEVKDIDSLYYSFNTKKNDATHDLDMIHWSGQEYIRDEIGTVVFDIGPKSFFQTNTNQAKVLYDLALEFSGLEGNECVYDLYTGLGSIALYVADRAEEVVGIEEIPEAIEDARHNASLNDVDNAHFYTADVRDSLTPQLLDEHGQPDVVITDPPRAGMHPDVVETLNNWSVPRLVYISCNPSTQARDIGRLTDNYEVERIVPVDMFPHTAHMEAVALLRAK